MGGANSINIEYNSFTSEQQMQILEDFKLTYSILSKKELILAKINAYEYIIYSNNYKIKFKHEVDLIHFVSKIGRPFVMISDSIYFVYNNV